MSEIHKEAQSVTPRHFAFDWLKAISILGVVYIHASVMVTNYLPGLTDNVGWLLVTLGNAYFRWSVPVFIMTSGALLLSREYINTSVFYRRRLWRIGVPLIVWTLVYECARSLLIPGEVFRLDWTLNRILYQQPYQHIYFLVILLGLMVVTPLLSRVVRALTLKDVAWLTVLFLFIGMMYFNRSSWAITLFIPYIGYYLAGYVLKNMTVSRWWWVGMGLVMWCVALCMTVATFIDTKIVNILNDTTRPFVSEFAYLSPLVMVLGLMAFLFFRQPRLIHQISRHEWLAKTFNSIGQRSLGIYMLHPILLLVAYAWIPNLAHLQQTSPVAVTIPLWLIVAGLSWLLSVMFKRLPFFTWIV